MLSKISQSKNSEKVGDQTSKMLKNDIDEKYSRKDISEK